MCRPNTASPIPITRRLIEEGRSHLLAPFDPGCPVRILQGMEDADVPWRHALLLVDLLQGGDVELTLIKDAEHRQSRPQDLAAPARHHRVGGCPGFCRLGAKLRKYLLAAVSSLAPRGRGLAAAILRA